MGYANEAKVVLLRRWVNVTDCSFTLTLGLTVSPVCLRQGGGVLAETAGDVQLCSRVLPETAEFLRETLFPCWTEELEEQVWSCRRVFSEFLNQSLLSCYIHENFVCVCCSLCVRLWDDILLGSVLKGQNVTGIRKDKGKKDVLMEQGSIVGLRTELLQRQQRYPPAHTHTVSICGSLTENLHRQEVGSRQNQVHLLFLFVPHSCFGLFGFWFLF